MEYLDYMVAPWTRVLLCGCLMVEGASTALWMASRLSMLAAYGGFTLALMLARGLMGALQLTTGSLLWRRAPAGEAIAPAIFLTSAALYALELGLRLRPSSVYPGARWILVVGYGIYAVTCAGLILRRRDPL
jgi:hypothetical protein